MRPLLYRIAVGLIFAWTGYLLLDLIYVALNYWSAVPWLGLIAIFSEPRIEPGFWGDYLKRLVTAWGSMVTGMGVVALLLRPPVQVVEGAVEAPPVSYPVVPESERTEPRLLYIEEQPPPAFDRRAAEWRRETESRATGGQVWNAEARMEPRWEGERSFAPEQMRRDREFGRDDEEPEVRGHPIRSSPILRALRGRSGAAPQPRSTGSSEPEPPRFTDEDYAAFEVYYDDGTTTIERLPRAEFGNDEATAVGVLRQRLAEEVAAGRRPAKAIRSISLVSELGFPQF